MAGKPEFAALTAELTALYGKAFDDGLVLLGDNFAKRDQIAMLMARVSELEGMVDPSDPPPAPPLGLGVGVYDDAAITYAGEWTIGTHFTLYSGHDHYSDDPAARASFAFRGSGVRLHAAKDFPHGIMSVRVDDRPPVDVDLYSADRVDALVAEILNLSEGSHTVELAHTGRKNPASAGTFVLLDKVEIVTGTVEPTPVPAPAPAPAPAPTGLVPPLAECGVQDAFVDERPGGTNLTTGKIERTRFTSPIRLAPGVRLELGGCDVPQIDAWPGGVALLDHCETHSGSWFSNAGQGGNGSHAGWKSLRSILRGGVAQTLRPMDAGTIELVETWLFTDPTTPHVDVHTETVQNLNGADIVSRRCAYSCRPLYWPNGAVANVTAVVNWSVAGNASSSTDDIFGYYDLATGKWGMGGGHYTIYPGNVTFNRPTVYKSHSGHWYRQPAPDKLFLPVYR